MLWQHFEALVWLYVAQLILIERQEAVIAENWCRIEANERRIEANEALLAREYARLGIPRG